MSESMHNFLGGLIPLSILAYTPLMTYNFDVGVLPCMILNNWAIVNCFKLFSYSHTMHCTRGIIERLRNLQGMAKKSDQPDPMQDLRYYIKPWEVNDANLELLQEYVKTGNIRLLLNIRDFCTFTLEPTLCFQLKFPRTNSIRWGWLAKRVFEYFAAHLTMMFIFGQYCIPIVEKAAVIYNEDGISFPFIARMLKLSVPSVIAWILMFFGGFQATCNIYAEITYFADREFFKEWWNCRTFAEYWKLWNLPVHNWILKHLYYPMLRKGYSPA